MIQARRLLVRCCRATGMQSIRLPAILPAHRERRGQRAHKVRKGHQMGRREPLVLPAHRVHKAR